MKKNDLVRVKMFPNITGRICDFLSHGFVLVECENGGLCEWSERELEVILPPEREES